MRVIRFLAAPALACVYFPAMAAEAAEPVTWGAVYTVLGWAGLGLAALIGVAIVLVIIWAAIGGFNDWSH